MTDAVELYIEKVSERAVLPAYAHEGDAGMDVAASEACLLRAGETLRVHTGLILHIPPGYEVQVRPRSGLSLRTKLRLPNSPGTIDSGYHDELMILVENTSRAPASTREDDDGQMGLPTCTLDVKGSPDAHYQIRVGDRIAQLVVAPVCHAALYAGKPPEELAMTENRGGGFGSSGLRSLRRV